VAGVAFDGGRAPGLALSVVKGFDGLGTLEEEKVKASSAGSGLSAGMSWQ